MNRICEFGDRLSQYRDANGYTLEFLSKKTGLPSQTLNRYELKQRVPKVDTAVDVAERLGVNPLWMQGYDVPMEKKEAAPDQLQLTEGEKALLELFRQIPQDHQVVVVQMVQAALNALL